jgi:thiosulfate dehydrogenase [quinone] large subunit
MSTKTTNPAAVETTSWYRGFGTSPAAHTFAGISRILLGLVFLWAFLDKTFGLGWATPSAQAWKFGLGDGSPTYGFLKFASNPDSPASSVWNSFANTAEGNPNAWTNWVFMLGLLGIGLGLTFGIFMRIATFSAVAMLFLMWLAEWPVTKVLDAQGNNTFNSPVLDDHVIYGVLAITLMLFGAERWLGLGKWWESRDFVKRMPWLA